MLYAMMGPGRSILKHKGHDVMKKWTCLASLIVFLCGRAFAQSGEFNPDNPPTIPSIPMGDGGGQNAFSVQAGPEVNLFARNTGVGAYFLAAALYRFNPAIEAGVKMGIGGGSGLALTSEINLIFRWYVPVSLPVCSIFLQAEAGLLGVWKSFEPEESRTFPTAGLGAGVRFYLGKTLGGWPKESPGRFYLEPFVRGGYPFLFGGGLMAGYQFY
jgi:hypothetical protein